jgi:tetratricopeptide (TPR) repeat protein
MSPGKTVSKARDREPKVSKAKAASTPEPLSAGARRNALLCFVLAAVTVAIYSPAIGHSFVKWDDSQYVTTNRHIQGGIDWNTIRWAFTSTDESNWHPLTWLSHALDCQFFALNPAGHHLHNVLLHALNAVLIFLLLVWMTRRVEPSLLVAALFAVHPLNVESVAWVAERKNVLSTLFFLLAIAAYVWYTQKPGWRRYLPVVALFAAALMAKPMVITLPFALLLLDYWPLERIQGNSATSNGPRQLPFRTLLFEKIPLLFLSFASAWITLIAQRTAERSFEEFPLAIRIENAVVAYSLYLWKMLWPARLALYPHSAVALPAWQWILSATVLTSVTVFVIAFRRKPYLPVGWFWFLGTLVPVIGLVQVGEASMADRYAYIPLIGIFVVIAWSLADWAQATRVRAIWVMIPAFCVLTTLSFATLRQLSYWESDYDLWSHALAVGESSFAHNAVAADLMNPALAMTPRDLASFNTDQERIDEARRHFERALELRRQLAHRNPGVYLPEMATTLTSLGTLDWLQNRLDEARSHDEEALEIDRQLAQQDPDKYRSNLAGPLVNLADLDRFQNRLDEARRHYQEALQYYRQLAQKHPDPQIAIIAATLNNLADVNRRQNRFDEARQNYEESATIYRRLAQRDPGNYLPIVASTLSSLALLDQREGRIENARDHYQEALMILRKLSQSDRRYAGDADQVASRLQEVN